MKYSIAITAILFALLPQVSHGQGKLKKFKEKLKAAASGPDMTSDPNYFYASHKATHSTTFDAVDGYLITKKEMQSETRIKTIFGKGKDAGSTSVRYPSISENKRLSELYGKPAYIGHNFCMDLDGKTHCLAKPGDDRMGRVLEVEDDVYLFYGGELTFSKNGQTYFPYIEAYTSSGSDEAPVLIMAKTPEKLAEWTQERAKKEVTMLEDKIKQKVNSEGAAALASVKMPSNGKMHTPDNFATAEALVRSLCEKDGTTFKELVLTSNDWKVVYKPGNKVIDYRIFMGYFADYNPKRDWCIIHTVSFRENHIGGKYSGDWFIGGVSQDPNVGPQVDCNNVGK